MRSWSKRVIFSRKWKSSSSVGPRRPALSESSVWGTGIPWSVVRTVSLGCSRNTSRLSFLVGIFLRRASGRTLFIGPPHGGSGSHGRASPLPFSNPSARSARSEVRQHFLSEPCDLLDHLGLGRAHAVAQVDVLEAGELLL